MASFTMDGTTIFSKSGSDITYANGTLGSGTIFPSGHVIQFKYANKTNTQFLNSTSFTDIVGFSLDITTKKTNSLIFVQADVKVSTDESSVWSGGHLRCVRTIGGTSTNMHQTEGSHGQQHSSMCGGLPHVGAHIAEPYTGLFADDHQQSSGTTINYKLQFAITAYTSASGYVNRAHDTSGTYSGTGGSNFTLWEIMP